MVVKPETGIGWHRRGFIRFWARRSRCGPPTHYDTMHFELRPELFDPAYKP